MTANTLFKSLCWFALSLVSVAHPVQALSLQVPQVTVLSGQEDPLAGQAPLLSALAKCCTEARLKQPLSHTLTSKKVAQVGLMSLFSGQSDGWYFEPITNNGLFRLMADYQPSHPKAITLDAGVTELGALTKQLNDDNLLRPFKDGYLLSYPLVIQPGATLLIDHTTLYLATHAGTVIINRGELSLLHSQLSSWRDKSFSLSLPHFKPFIVSWSDSQTRIDHSRLMNLGYEGHLTHGLTLLRHPTQPEGSTAYLESSHSEFSQMDTAITAQNAILTISESTFHDLHRYGLDLQQVTLLFQQNHVENIKLQSGMRIQGHSAAILRDNLFDRTGKAGIELHQADGYFDIDHNLVGHAQSDGLSVRDNEKPTGALRIRGNLFANSARSGVVMDSALNAFITGNRFTGNAAYAIQLDQHSLTQGHSVILNNTFFDSGEAAITAKNIRSLLLGNNQWNLPPGNHAVFSGDLQALQGTLMKALMDENTLLKVSQSP